MMFGSVIVVAFQNIFHTEMYQMMFFYFLKKLFLRPTHQNGPKYKKNYFLAKNKLN
jgi:hypothetical protein